MPPDQLLNTPPGARTSYWRGRDLLLDGDPQNAAIVLRACLADEGDIALALVALALALYLAGSYDEHALARAEKASSRDISRRERQHVAVVALALRGRVSRASALGREHLAEFPDDCIVHFVLTTMCGELDVDLD